MTKNSYPLVSVIVPVYNAEKYVKRCITSLLNQTYPNVEIIVIDDGSTDKSSLVLESIKKKASQLTVVRKKNEGVSAARMKGLLTAKGEYVMFVDADDYVDNDYVEYFYNLINCEEGLNIAMDYNKYYIYDSKQVDREVVEVLSSQKVMEYIYTSKIMEAVWNKMYRRSFLNKNKIQFEREIWYGEGMLFNMTCLQYTDKVVIGNKRVYHQAYNVSSAMREFRMDSNLCGLRSLDLQRKIWKHEYKNVLRAWKYHKWCFNMSILKGIIKSGTKQKYLQEYKACKKNLRKGWYYPWTVDLAISRKLFYALSGFFPVTMAKILLNTERNKSAISAKSTGGKQK